MLLTFVQLPRFAARWDRLELNDDDLRSLESAILRDPDAGAVIPGTGGLRKIRFAPPSRHTGKSGAFRVCYVYFRTAEAIYLLAIYPKNEQANLTAQQKSEAKSLIEFIGRGIRKIK
ncbi:MAG TPA: type II toxin-antitoxin system RelE/ParE family toxin [Tepidisphaeraceae bacterium]|nr:type II toxin-antitoxin system RelE/ParE family toxin [Tepidisphaeraceae bacterium]